MSSPKEPNVFQKTLNNPNFQADVVEILNQRLKEAEEEKQQKQEATTREIRLRQQINLEDQFASMDLSN